MFNIKRARNNFTGFRAIVSEAEFDKSLYILESAAGLYSETGSERLDSCQKLIRVWTELAYFDKEKREVHLQMSFRELEVLTTAFYDVMLVYIQQEPMHSFNKLVELPETKIWINSSSDTNE